MEMAAKYAAHFETVRKHLADQKKSETLLLTLSQITKTLDYLRVLIERGVPIPPAKMERLATD